MAILDSVDVQPSALWPQGDIRDPLGVWGCRKAVTGDASGGSIKVLVRAPAGRNASYVYTCYGAIIVQITGAANTVIGKVRLLTNWPNVDPQAGIQGYGHAQFINIDGATTFTQPQTGPFLNSFISPNDRFILLFDPRPSAGTIEIMEIELHENTLALEWSFEAYGYFWDRSVLQAPGGPRHPGAS